MTKLVEASLKGLDCASCATRLENSLRATPGLEACRVSFATESVVYPEGEQERVARLISASEPGVRFESPDAQFSSDRPDSALNLAKNLWRVSLAGLSLLALLLFDQALPGWLAWGIAILAWFLAGQEVIFLALKNLIRGKVFDENFLMTLATAGAFALEHLPEAVGVMLFYHVGELAQDKALNSSRNAIKALASLMPEHTRVIDNKENSELVLSQNVLPGALIEVWPGERVSHDGVLASAEAWFDTSALTGESRPRLYKQGEKIEAGFQASAASARIKVSERVEDSAAARITRLVKEAAGRKARSERFITRFASVYTPTVVLGALLLAFLPPLIINDASFEVWAMRALVFLVISCPCALVISIPLGYFAGIGAASRLGLLVKGGVVLDRLARVGTLAFDKTGTLTDGEFKLRELVTAPGRERREVLGLAAALEARSNHPLALAIKAAWDAEGGKTLPELGEIHEIRGRGVEALGSKRLALGSATFLHELGFLTPEFDLPPEAIVHLASPGEWLGSLVVEDRVRESAAPALAELKSLGIKEFAVLSGDQAARTKALAQELGIETAHGDLLPADKLSHLESLIARSQSGATVFVGDGINDAPVIRRADLGIAIGGLASDAAIEAADAVMVYDDLGILPRGIRLARATRRIIWQNIGFALGFKLVFLLLGGMGLASLWEAVIADVGVALVSLANALRLIRPGLVSRS